MKISTSTIYTNEELNEIARGYYVAASCDGSCDQAAIRMRGRGALGFGWQWCSRVVRLANGDPAQRQGFGPAGPLGCPYDAERVALRELASELAAAVSHGVLAECRKSLERRGTRISIAIFTDCQSILQALLHSGSAPGDEAMLEITRTINNLAEFAQVSLYHVKGHNDVDANEQVDKLAKQGLAAGISRTPSHGQVFQCDMQVIRR